MAFAEGEVPLTNVVWSTSGQLATPPSIFTEGTNAHPRGTVSPSCWKGENGHFRSPFGRLDRKR